MGEGFSDKSKISDNWYLQTCCLYAVSNILSSSHRKRAQEEDNAWVVRDVGDCIISLNPIGHIMQRHNTIRQEIQSNLHHTCSSKWQISNMLKNREKVAKRCYFPIYEIYITVSFQKIFLNSMYFLNNQEWLSTNPLTK